MAEIKKLVQNINKVSKAESLKEDYSGPILFEGNLVGDILFSNLFSFGFSLNAWRNDLVLENSNKVYFAEISNKLQFKIGEQIFPKHITIISYSKRKEYKGHKLLGSYNIDAEGVIPADSLIMVKNGILKNLYSSRLPTNISEKSSGRRRYSFNRNQIGVRSGPGTLHFKSSAATSIDELKSRLIRMAKDQGFKYAYILRSIPSKIANLSANCYQVDVETGKEILVDDIALRYKLKRQVLKNLVGVSDSTFIYNSLWNNDRKNMGQNSVAETGLLVSLIIPSAILVDNAEIRTQTSNKNLNLKQEEISNPLERSY